MSEEIWRGGYELAEIRQDIRAMKYASPAGVEAIAHAMRGLGRFTTEAQAVYKKRGGIQPTPAIPITEEQ